MQRRDPTHSTPSRPSGSASARARTSVGAAALAVCGLLVALLLSAPALGAERHEFARLAMGTRIRLVIVAEEEAAAAETARVAFERLEAIDHALSDWRSDSELEALNRAAGGEPLAIGPDLRRCLAASLAMARATDGAFDPTVGPLVRLWREAKRAERLPDPAVVAATRALVGHRGLHLDDAAAVAGLAREGMRLDLGGIGKGYAVDELRDLVVSRGFPACLVDFGSAVAAGDPPPGAEAWSVSLPDGGTIGLRNAGLATSGDAEQWVEIDGTRLSHLVDPRPEAEGLALAAPASAVAVAERATVADALATAACVLGPVEALRLAATLPEPCALRVEGEVDGRRATLESPGFDDAGLRAGAAAAPGPTVAEAAPVARRRTLPPRRLVLEVPVVRLEAPERPPISLVGVTHIGSAALYQRLQEILDGHELVLWESVMPAGIRGAAQAPPGRRAVATRASMDIVAAALERHRRRGGALPADVMGIAAAITASDSRFAPFAEALVLDGWGRPFAYELRFDAEGEVVDFALRSAGADGAEGGSGDDADLERRRPREPGLEEEGLQADLAAALGLRFQLTSIDYDRPSWRFADMTADQLEAALAARGVEAEGMLGTLAGSSLPGRVVKLLLGVLRFADGLTGGAVRDSLRLVIIETLAAAEGLEGMPGMDEGFMKVVIDDRNEVVIDEVARALDETPAPESIAIFYGAGHNPGLARLLRERFDYRPVAIEWLPAIEVDLDTARISEAQVAQFRAMIRRAMGAGPRNQDSGIRIQESGERPNPRIPNPES